jgi:TctA family transporter
MPGLVPGIHVFTFFSAVKAWMAGTSSAKTRFALLPGHDGNKHLELNE